MSNEKAIAAALEPIVESLVALEAHVEAIQFSPGPKGDAGADADPAAIAAILAEDASFAARVKGRDGKHGAGITATPWQAGEVYRDGTHVVAHLGQHYVAERDTASVPGDSPHWRRVGAGGFRHRGAFDKDAQYLDGDLYRRDLGTFCIVNGDHVLLAGRGERGKTGELGARGVGAPGKDGRDGTTIIGAQVQGFKLVLVAQDADGAIDHLEADFAPAYRELARETIEAAVPDLFLSIDALRDEIADLKRALGRRAA